MINNNKRRLNYISLIKKKKRMEENKSSVHVWLDSKENYTNNILFGKNLSFFKEKLF